MYIHIPHAIIINIAHVLYDTPHDSPHHSLRTVKCSCRIIIIWFLCFCFWKICHVFPRFWIWSKRIIITMMLIIINSEKNTGRSVELYDDVRARSAYGIQVPLYTRNTARDWAMKNTNACIHKYIIHMLMYIMTFFSLNFFWKIFTNICDIRSNIIISSSSRYYHNHNILSATNQKKWSEHFCSFLLFVFVSVTSINFMTIQCLCTCTYEYKYAWR